MLVHFTSLSLGSLKVGSNILTYISIKEGEPKRCQVLLPAVLRGHSYLPRTGVYILPTKMDNAFLIWTFLIWTFRQGFYGTGSVYII